jgi:hypothetical protein
VVVDVVVVVDSEVDSVVDRPMEGFVWMHVR